MPSTWEKWKAARAQQKTPEEQAISKKNEEEAFRQFEGLMGGGMAGTTRRVAGPLVRKILRKGAPQVKSAGKAIGDAGRATKKAALIVGRAAKDKLSGASRKLGSLKEKVVALTTGGVVGTSIFRGQNANQTPKPEVKSTTPAPAAAAKTETKKADVKPTPKATQSEAKPTGSSPEYKTFAKGSQEAKDFRKNFGEARKSGAKEFEFQGRKYNTKVKGE